MLLSEMSVVMKNCAMIEGLSPATIKNYLKAMRRVIAYVGDTEVSEFTRKRVEAYLAYHRQGTSNATIYFDVAAIRKFVGLAVREGELEEDWSRTLKLPNVKRKLPSAMPIEQAIRIINEWPMPRASRGLSRPLARFNQIRNRTMMALALFTGARSKEVVGLDFNDLDFASDTVHLRNTKGGDPRIIPMHPQLKLQLESYTKLRIEYVPTPIRQLPALFVSRHKGKWGRLLSTSYSIIFKEHVRALGLPSERAHNMRHTFATTLLRNKTDLLTIKELMGHERLETTMIYLKVDQTMKREAVNSLPIRLVPDEN